MILLLGNSIKSDCSQTLYNITDKVIKCQTKYTVGIIPKSNITAKGVPRLAAAPQTWHEYIMLGKVKLLC